MRLFEVRIVSEVGHDCAGDALAPALEIDRRAGDGLEFEGGHVSDTPAEDLAKGELKGRTKNTILFLFFVKKIFKNVGEEGTIKEGKPKICGHSKR